MTRATEAIENLADAMASGDRISLRAVQWEEGWTVNLYRAGRLIPTTNCDPRTRLEDAVTDALRDMWAKHDTATPEAPRV